MHDVTPPTFQSALVRGVEREAKGLIISLSLSLSLSLTLSLSLSLPHIYVSSLLLKSQNITCITTHLFSTRESMLEYKLDYDEILKYASLRAHTQVRLPTANNITLIFYASGDSKFHQYDISVIGGFLSEFTTVTDGRNYTAVLSPAVEYGNDHDRYFVAASLFQDLATNEMWSRRLLSGHTIPHPRFFI